MQGNYFYWHIINAEELLITEEINVSIYTKYALVNKGNAIGFVVSVKFSTNKKKGKHK